MNILSKLDFDRLRATGMLYVVLGENATGDYEDYLKANGISGGSMKGQLGNIKIWVKNPEHSACVQKRLFELGYAWPVSDCRVSYTDQDFLFGYSSGLLMQSGNIHHFNNHNNPEYMFSDEEIGYAPAEPLLPVSTGLPMPTVKQPKEQGFVRSREVVVTERMVEIANGIAVNAEGATKAIPNEWLGELMELNSELREILSNENN